VCCFRAGERKICSDACGTSSIRLPYRTKADLVPVTPAFLAIDALEQAVIRGSTGPSIWRIWFADLSRKRLSALTAGLRNALVAYSEDRSGTV
jgi:hypothetical protein